jgi:repressor LexA
MRRADSPDLYGGGLTWCQRRIIRFIQEFSRCNGYGPSRREIGKAVGLASTSSVSYQLRRLDEKGYLSLGPGRSRAIMLVVPADPAVRDRPDLVPGAAREHRLAQVPLAGRIAAGPQIFAAEMVEDVLPLPSQLVGEGDFIMLRVAGDSMIGAAIADGDLVVVRTNSDAENGDIVAAEIESETLDGYEATVKTLRKRDGHAWLVPQNPTYEPINGDKAKILGRVVAVLRRL